MATIMEKDVLLEIAHIGHLFVGMDETPEMDADARAMGRIYNTILDTPFDQIDFDATVAQIKALRSKYEKTGNAKLGDFLKFDAGLNIFRG